MRFARTHVALQQAAHWKRLRHVVSDFFQHSFLSSRGMERENLLDRSADVFIQTKRDAGLRLLFATFEFKSQFDEKQLLENQADVSRRARGLQILQAFAWLGPVNFAATLHGAKSGSDDCGPRPGWDQATPAADSRARRE